MDSALKKEITDAKIARHAIETNAHKAIKALMKSDATSQKKQMEKHKIRKARKTDLSAARKLLFEKRKALEGMKI